MQAIRLAAVQALLLAKPELVLDLLGFGLSEASGNCESVFGIRLDRPTNVPSAEDGFSREPRLDHGTDPTAYWQNGTRVEDLSEAFVAFREFGKRARNAKITETIAHTPPYQAGGMEFFGLIAEVAGVDIRKHWTPTRCSQRSTWDCGTSGAGMTFLSTRNVAKCRSVDPEVAEPANPVGLSRNSG